VLLFSKNKRVGVQTILLKLVNNHCPELGPAFENRRDETRAPVCVVTLVVPLDDGKPQLADHFPTVTKELSTTGVSIVLEQPRGLDELILAFRWEREMTFLKGTARHLSPMGAGFFQLGVELTKVVSAAEYPELDDLLI
jgi:hypothetical protein